MPSIDRRTRFDGDQLALDPDTFLAHDAPARVDANSGIAARSARAASASSLTLDVDGDPVTFRVVDDRVVVDHTVSDELVVSVDIESFSDLVQDVASTFALQMTGRATVQTGSSDAFLEWEPVLRSLLDGRPAYEPGSITFEDRSGAPLDVRRSFHVDDDPAEIGHFLAEAGFLHLQGVFTEDEMTAVSADLDVARAGAEPDDGASWWATTDSGESYASRVLGFNQKSAALRELLSSERFRTIGTFTDDTFVQRDPFVGDSAEGLLKKVGVVDGISDVSWHKDCAMGGHSRHCCGLVTGISVTGAGPENGELGVVPGSHRANIAVLGVQGLDLERLPLPTQTGDVTIHCACTLHMSRPPVSAERRVVYTGFGLAPRPGDHVRDRTPEEIRADRASLNDHVRARRGVGTSTRAGDFDLW